MVGTAKIVHSMLDKGISKSLSNNFLAKRILNTNPKTLESLSRKKALMMFKLSAKKVPFYSKFLNQHKIDYSKIKSYEEFKNSVPVMTKKNYVKKAESIKSLCFDGDLTSAEIFVRSSGFSGKPCVWPKSQEEQNTAKSYARFGLDLLFGINSYSTLLVNCFALGSWVSGVDLLLLANGVVTTINPGPSLEEALELFATFSSEFDQILFAGNPVFLKDLVDDGVKKKIGWEKSRVSFLTGGESITEDWRSYMYEKIGANPHSKNSGFVYSAFGASDMGVTGINETADSARIRKETQDNIMLKNDLFSNTAGLPMLFQYDPLQYNIIVDSKGHLIFTNCSTSVMKPLIKYDLNDVGGVIRKDVMQEILDKHKVNVKIKSSLPFLFVCGRADGTVSFCSSLIYPENVSGAFYNDKKLGSATTGRFRMSILQDKKKNEFLNVDIQLRIGVKNSKSLSALFEKQILESLKAHNDDFLSDYENLTKKKRTVLKTVLYEYEKYPHKDGIKVRYTD